jgi:LacI family transcriptional regulator
MTAREAGTDQVSGAEKRWGGRMTGQGENQNESRRRTRIVDIAAVAGYSASAVSRVLIGKGEVSEETRRRILAVATELGYDRDSERRGRPRPPGQLINLTLAYLDTAWAADAIAGAWKTADALGFDILLTSEHDSPDRDWVQRAQFRGVAGAIVGLIRPTSEERDRLARAGIPIVMLDPRADGPQGVASIGTSDRQGGIDAGMHLVATGATRFVGVVGTPQYRFGRARMQGFAEAVERARPDAPVEIVRTDWSPTAAADSLVPVLKGAKGRIGLFAVNDAMATGAYAAAAHVGISIPDELSVVGFDDEPTSRFLTPPLTTVELPLREAAATAVRLIVAASTGTPIPGQRIEIPSRLIVRGSTGHRTP